MCRLPSSIWWGKKMVLPPGLYTLSLDGRAMEQKGMRGGAGVRRSLFDLFSLVSGCFCFVVFLLVSCFFSLSNYFGLSVTIWRNA